MHQKTNTRLGAPINHADLFRGTRGAVLRALWDGRWHSYAELKTIGVRYGARLAELRREGWQIEDEQIPTPLCEAAGIGPGKRYRLASRHQGVPILPPTVRPKFKREDAAHLLACRRRSPGWVEQAAIIEALAKVVEP